MSDSPQKGWLELHRTQTQTRCLRRGRSRWRAPVHLVSCFSEGGNAFQDFPGFPVPAPTRDPVPEAAPSAGCSHSEEGGGFCTPGLPGPSCAGMAAATWSRLPRRAGLLKPRQVGAGAQPRRVPPARPGPARAQCRGG